MMSIKHTTTIQVEAEEKIPFTRDAYTNMQKKVNELTKELKEVMIRLKDAREMGDLSENGAYKYAKMEMGRIKRELKELHTLLRRGIVMEPKHSEVIGFGSVVTLAANDGKTISFKLVSQYESDPANQKLSLDSPIGLALKDKRVGDTVQVATPKGTTIYKVTALG